MEDSLKEYSKTKKAGEGAEEAYRNFHRWLWGFLGFSACYLETRPEEHTNVIRYLYLINELFSMGIRGISGGTMTKSFVGTRTVTPSFPWVSRMLRFGLR